MGGQLWSPSSPSLTCSLEDGSLCSPPLAFLLPLQSPCRYLPAFCSLENLKFPSFHYWPATLSAMNSSRIASQSIKYMLCFIPQAMQCQVVARACTLLSRLLSAQILCDDQASPAFELLAQRHLDLMYVSQHLLSFRVLVLRTDACAT